MQGREGGQKRKGGVRRQVCTGRESGGEGVMMQLEVRLMGVREQAEGARR